MTLLIIGIVCLWLLKKIVILLLENVWFVYEIEKLIRKHNIDRNDVYEVLAKENTARAELFLNKQYSVNDAPWIKSAVIIALKNK